MTENKLRQAVGIFLIFVHFAILGIIFYLFMLGGFRFDEFTTSIAIIAPMFAGYTTAIVINFAKNRFILADNSEKVNGVFIVFSFFFPVLFAVAITVCLFSFAYAQVFSDFEQFKATLTIIESTFAAYVANFVYTLFEKAKLPEGTNVKPDAQASTPATQ